MAGRIPIVLGADGLPQQLQSGDEALTALGVLALVSGTVLSTFPPRRGQFFKALEAFQAGAVSTVTGAVPSDPGSATNIAFAHTTFVVQTGTLAQFVKTTLGLTDAQLTTIIGNARSVTE